MGISLEQLQLELKLVILYRSHFWTDFSPFITSLGVRYNLRFSIQLIEIIKDNIHLGVRCGVRVRFSPPRPFMGL